METTDILALIALAFGVLGPIVSFYATSQVMGDRLSRAEADINDLNQKHESLGPILAEIRQGLARIEGRLQGKN